MTVLRGASASVVAVAVISTALTAAVVLPVAFGSSEDSADELAVVAGLTPAASSPDPQSTPTETPDAEVLGVAAVPTPTLGAQSDPTLAGPGPTPSPQPEDTRTPSEELGPPEATSTPQPTATPEPTPPPRPTPDVALPTPDPTEEPTAPPTPTVEASDDLPDEPDSALDPPATPLSSGTVDLTAVVQSGTVTEEGESRIDIHVLNTGNSVAPDVTLNIELTGAEPLQTSANDPSWSCVTVERSVRCTASSLKPGASFATALLVAADSEQFQVVVEVSHGLDDETPEDNRVEVLIGAA